MNEMDFGLVIFFIRISILIRIAENAHETGKKIIDWYTGIYQIIFYFNILHAGFVFIYLSFSIDFIHSNWLRMTVKYTNKRNSESFQ